MRKGTGIPYRRRLGVTWRKVTYRTPQHESWCDRERHDADLNALDGCRSKTLVRKVGHGITVITARSMTDRVNYIELMLRVPLIQDTEAGRQAVAEKIAGRLVQFGRSTVGMR